MVIRYITILLCCLLITLNSQAQTKPAKIWASVQFNKKSVMVGEPLVVTITVYTSTWFTNPPEFGEIQVPKALMARLEQRTGSSLKTIGKKQYPAIEQKFVVYPIQVGENRLPSITIVTESPPEGDYKGRKRTIRSPERKFNVLAPPAGIETDKWLTAYDVQLTETWDRPLTNLKTGDVLERRIKIRASGALASLIPPLELEEIEFGSIYPKTPTLSNVQNPSSFSGLRTEVSTYLIEKAGTYTLPEVSLSWFNPRSKKLETKTLAAKELVIEENPNLEFLLSMQDSLRALLATEEPAAAAPPFEFMGLNWWQLLIAVLSGIALIYLIIRALINVNSLLKKRRAAEAESEKHYFEMLQKTSKTGNQTAFMRQLLFWYDHFREDKYQPELEDFLTKSNDEQLEQESRAMNTALFGKTVDQPSWSSDKIYQHLIAARKKSKQKQKKEQSTLSKLNP